MSDSGDGLTIPIVTTADVSGAHQQAAAIKKVTDETARYQAALEKLATTQEEANRATTKAADAAQMEERKLSRQRQNLEYKKLVAEADKDIAAGVITVSKEDIKAAEAVVQATDKVVLGKRQMKDAIKGIASQFPLLAQAAALALNPITASVALLTGAWAIWTERVKQAMHILAGMELPDISPRLVGQVNAMAAAYQKMAEALRATDEAYASVDRGSERRIKRIQDELEQQRNLLAAQKALALAELETRKGSMSEQEYASRRKGIEDHFAAAGLKASQSADTASLAERSGKVQKLRDEATQKETEARGIKVMTPEQEAQISGDLAKRKEVAVAEEKETRGRLGDIAEYEAAKKRPDYDGRAYAIKATFEGRYGRFATPEEARSIEQANLARAQGQIGQSDRFAQDAAKREKDRRRQQELMDQATKDRAEARDIQNSLEEERFSLRKKQTAESKVAGIEGQTRTLGLVEGERGTSLGQKILRAAQMARLVQSKQTTLANMSPEDRAFLESMDMGLTGGKVGQAGRALATFAGADDPARFAQFYGRMSGVAAVKQDAATAQAIQMGQAVDQASKEQLMQHARLLLGVTATMDQFVKITTHSADHVENVNARMTALEARQRQLDTRNKGSLNQ